MSAELLLHLDEANEELIRVRERYRSENEAIRNSAL